MAEIDWKLIATALYLERSGEEPKSLAVMMYENALDAEGRPAPVPAHIDGDPS